MRQSAAAGKRNEDGAVRARQTGCRRQQKQRLTRVLAIADAMASDAGLAGVLFAAYQHGRVWQSKRGKLSVKVTAMREEGSRVVESATWTWARLDGRTAAASRKSERVPRTKH